MSTSKLVIALRAVADALEASESETAAAPSEPATPAPKRGGKKAVAAPESPQPAATPAPTPVTATAPAAVAAPAQSPAAATTFPSIEKLNKAVLALAGKARPKAIDVLAKYKVANTAELKPEQYQAVIDDSEEALAALDAAAAQVSLV